MKKVAVVLSGCGHLDGTEITEAVSLLVALSEARAEVTCFAPGLDVKVVDPVSGQEGPEVRNTFRESARISRGKIHDLSNLKSEKFDGLAFPGGFGAAKNLCSWATRGAGSEVHPGVKKVILEFFQESKPILGICIAPALLSLVLGSEGIEVTIGNDKETAREIEKTGARHQICAVDNFVSDREAKVITTPAYMYEAEPFQVFTGIRKATREFLEMA